jgi:hypothetical protein
MDEEIDDVGVDERNSDNVTEAETLDTLVDWLPLTFAEWVRGDRDVDGDIVWVPELEFDSVVVRVTDNVVECDLSGDTVNVLERPTVFDLDIDNVAEGADAERCSVGDAVDDNEFDTDKTSDWLPVAVNETLCVLLTLADGDCDADSEAICDGLPDALGDILTDEVVVADGAVLSVDVILREISDVVECDRAMGESVALGVALRVVDGPLWVRDNASVSEAPDAEKVMFVVVVCAILMDCVTVPVVDITAVRVSVALLVRVKLSVVVSASVSVTVMDVVSVGPRLVLGLCVFVRVTSDVTDALSDNVNIKVDVKEIFWDVDAEGVTAFVFESDWDSVRIGGTVTELCEAVSDFVTEFATVHEEVAVIECDCEDDVEYECDGIGEYVRETVAVDEWLDEAAIVVELLLARDALVVNECDLVFDKVCDRLGVRERVQSEEESLRVREVDWVCDDVEECDVESVSRLDNVIELVALGGIVTVVTVVETELLMDKEMDTLLENVYEPVASGSGVIVVRVPEIESLCDEVVECEVENVLLSDREWESVALGGIVTVVIVVETEFDNENVLAEWEADNVLNELLRECVEEKEKLLDVELVVWLTYSVPWASHPPCNRSHTTTHTCIEWINRSMQPNTHVLTAMRRRNGGKNNQHAMPKNVLDQRIRKDPWITTLKNKRKGMRREQLPLRYSFCCSWW